MLAYDSNPSETEVIELGKGFQSSVTTNFHRRGIGVNSGITHSTLRQRLRRSFKQHLVTSTSYIYNYVRHAFKFRGDNISMHLPGISCQWARQLPTAVCCN
jgi:hypothetical protein